MSQNNLKNAINLWIEYNKNISTINNKLKSFKEKKILVENNILDFIETNKLTNTKIKYNEQNITYKSYETLAPISIKLLIKTLQETIDNEEIINIILNKLNEKRSNNKKINRQLKIKKT